MRYRTLPEAGGDPIQMQLSTTERRILDMIWRRGPIARGDLAASTGLTPASVTRVIQELLELRLVGESVDRSGGRGQPTRPVSIQVDGAHAIGVYFSHRSVEIGLVDMAGSQLEARTLDGSAANPDAVSALTRDFIDDIVGAGKVRRETLAGIGIALPGDFIRGAEQLHSHAYFPALAQPGAIRSLAQGIDLPVFVENDAASAALGERLLGAGQRIDDFLFVHVGHGIGGALMMNGRLYRGVNGNAGMIGIQFPNHAPRPSGQDLFAHLSRHGIDIVDFPQLETLSVGGCPPLRAWIRRAGGQLREQLGLTARVLDPAAIIIGGRLPLAMLSALVAEIDTPEFCNEGVGLPRPRILASPLGNKAGMIGAASLPIFRTLMDHGENRETDVPGIRL